jgi:hypothetical protein
MTLWANLDASNNAPRIGATAGYGASTPQVTNNTRVYFANTQIGAYSANQAIGVFGVDTTEQGTSASSTTTGHPQHAGWVIRRVGTGPVTSITANAASVGQNTYINLSKGDGIDGSGNTMANVQVSVNTAGYITSVAVLSGGNYANTPIISNVYTSQVFTGNNAVITNKAYTNAVFTIVVGGRAGRVQTETIVAMGSMTGDGDTVF